MRYFIKDVRNQPSVLFQSLNKFYCIPIKPYIERRKLMKIFFIDIVSLHFNVFENDVVSPELLDWAVNLPCLEARNQAFGLMKDFDLY